MESFKEEEKLKAKKKDAEHAAREAETQDKVMKLNEEMKTATQEQRNELQKQKLQWEDQISQDRKRHLDDVAEARRDTAERERRLRDNLDEEMQRAREKERSSTQPQQGLMESVVGKLLHEGVSLITGLFR